MFIHVFDENTKAEGYEIWDLNSSKQTKQRYCKWINDLQRHPQLKLLEAMK